MREPANLVPSMRKPRGRHQIFYSSMHGSRVIRDSDTPKYGHMTIFGHTASLNFSGYAQMAKYSAFRIEFFV